MADNDYHFITEWRVPGTVAVVKEILNDAPDLARWWPSVYLDIVEREPGDDSGLGNVIELYTKGWLPYTLRWSCRITEVRKPYGFSLEAWGDFIGTGVWRLAQDGPFVDVTYDWRIVVDKPLLRRLSFILRPIFAKNHEWAMAKGEESLKLELARRHAATPEERARVPAPPGPTWPRPKNARTLLRAAPVGRR